MNHSRTKLYLESGTLCVRVFLSLRTCQINKVQLRCSDVHHLIFRLLGFQRHREHGVRP